MPPPLPDTSNSRPLVVDLDGTLVSTDTMLESILRLLRRRPWMIVALLGWCGGGLVSFKRRVAAAGVIDPQTLPWRQDVIAYVVQQRAAGRTTVLATASHIAVARAMAEHVQCFDRVIATDRDENVRGEAKVRAIRRQLGTEAFDYIGDSHMDLPVWRAAAAALLVSPGADIERAARGHGNVAHVFRRSDEPKSRAAMVWRSIRPGGAVVIVAMLLIARVLGVLPLSWSAAALLCVSGASLWAGLSVARDLFCLEADRRRTTGPLRPIAGGFWPLASAIKTALLLLLLAAVAMLAVFALSWPGPS